MFHANKLHNCVGLWTACSNCKNCNLTAGKMKYILNTEWKHNENDNCSQLLMHINKPVRVPVVIMATDAHRFILLLVWPGSNSTWLQQSYGVTHCVLAVICSCVCMKNTWPEWTTRFNTTLSPISKWWPHCTETVFVDRNYSSAQKHITKELPATQCLLQTY